MPVLGTKLLNNRIVTIKAKDGTYVGTVSFTEEAGVWITPKHSIPPTNVAALGKVTLFVPFAQMIWLAAAD